MYSFSERLTDVRVENGFGQKDIAEKLNITTSAYGYYEQGKNEPSIETIRTLAKLFDVSTDYLLGLIDQPKHPINFTIKDDFTLTDSELQTVKHMKEQQLLSELSVNPVENVEKLTKLWKFIKEL
ncbi:MULTISPECIES: helix-turn-helix transcriptional regulator [Clostridia]|uniref:helix-turn-helix domain-containing protein n=1 Tax=Clostridia TaxID=186801 RepID=UPI000EA0DAE4|nr:MULTISPECIES: helix-turn-helix transcriptional regulator [Clostridia]NBJ71608.1 XRE family transcriptional regulator [Roseburia sp. 1XD42-34]RKI76842.1 XRE family transcriptional regulator [Clostridium sp. 1xD42-85]